MHTKAATEVPQLSNWKHSETFRTYKRLSATLYWPGMMKMIQKYVTECLTCQKHKYEASSPARLLQPQLIPKQVWEDIAMDFITDLLKSQRMDAILVVINRLTKYGHFIPLRHPYSAQTVAVVFAKEVVRSHGMPRPIVSDWNPIFLSNFWTELFKLQGTQLRMSTDYYPEIDGQTKVLNQGLETYLRCFSSEQPRKWCNWLPWAKYWYNTSHHAAVNTSTFEALYGRPPLTLHQFLLREIKNRRSGTRIAYQR